MMREKITRWAEQTPSGQWQDLEAMIVIGQDKKSRTPTRGEAIRRQ